MCNHPCHTLFDCLIALLIDRVSRLSNSNLHITQVTPNHGTMLIGLKAWWCIIMLTFCFFIWYIFDIHAFSRQKVEKQKYRPYRHYTYNWWWGITRSRPNTRGLPAVANRMNTRPLSVFDCLTNYKKCNNLKVIHVLRKEPNQVKLGNNGNCFSINRTGRLILFLHQMKWFLKCFLGHPCSPTTGVYTY